MTIIEKLKEWERETDYTFDFCTSDFIQGIKQGLRDSIELLEDEEVDKEI